MTTSLENKLLKRENLGNLRELQLQFPAIDFSSNDTLGLSRSPRLIKLLSQEINGSRSLGSTGSRLLTGNSFYIEQLEQKIAAFHGYPAGLLFNCGYMANMGLISAIATKDCIFFYDVKVHASIRDGIRLSKAKAFPFKHNNLEHLERRLKNCPFKGDRFILVESIYSTDGSIAPLVEISTLAKKYGAHLIVDEAHATGIYGPNGKGLISKYQLTDSVFAHVITFGKALGTFGALILGSLTLKKSLINFATSYIYTTALPFQVLAAIKSSYDLFPEMEEERKELQKLIKLFRGLYPKASFTHIQPILIKGNQAVKDKSKEMAEHGFDVRALTSPTVQKGEETLRICLHAFNTEKELRKLIIVV